jgi:hypothetical protein
MAPSALSHWDCAPGAGAEDCFTSVLRFLRVELEQPPLSSDSTSCLSRPALLRRRWRVVCWVDILLDVISGVERALREMSEDNDRCFSMLVLGAFSTGVKRKPLQGRRSQSR